MVCHLWGKRLTIVIGLIILDKQVCGERRKFKITILGVKKYLPKTAFLPRGEWHHPKDLSSLCTVGKVQCRRWD